jgi:UDP-N-acetylglucosamine--dolichyl-phosphate N-acetylglucosaminephosphotransferase
MEKILFIPILVGFIVTLFFIPIWIKRAKKAGIVGKDQQKLNKKEVVEAGGISVLLGFVLGVLTYIQINTFYFNSTENLIEIFAILGSILIIGFIGFTDDILGWKIGLNKKIRILFLIFAAIPLVVINAGESNMVGIEFGLIYPLLFIPLGIVGASTTFNFIAGYNGLETSQGILILISLAIVTNFTGNSWLSLICLTMVICLVAFYIFNKYPAKVFPGDILTYSVGALIAIIAILGNIEKIALFFFIPYIIETGLKVRGKLEKESFAKIDSKGNLEVPHEKFYGIEHIAIYILKKYKKEVNEKDVVYSINLFQIIIIILGLIIFRNTIF